MFNPAITWYPSVTALSSTKFVVAYTDWSYSSYGTAIIGDVSGATVTYGSEYVFNAASTDYTSVVALSSTKFVVSYRDTGYSYYGTAIIGDVSGATITYGSEYVFNAVFNNDYISVAALSSTKFMVSYRDIGNGAYGTAIIGDVSGATITYGPEYVFNTANTWHISVAALSSTRFVVSYGDAGNSGYGTAIIGEAVVGSDIVGIAQASKTAGETVPVIIAGISDVHSGLTTGQTYYSDTAGDLSTNTSDWRVGLAVSSSEILLNSDQSNGDQFFGDMVFNNNFRITEAGGYEGLILKNQLSQDVLNITEAGDLNTEGDMHVGGYVQLDTVAGAPPAEDCDEASEEGRMKFDPVSEVFYLCATSGWVTK